MKKHTHPILPNRFYHIFNRGINGENLFKEERNYRFFLQRYAKYIQPVADTFAYCLLKNHFHFMIRTFSTAEVIDNVGRGRSPADVNNLTETLSIYEKEKLASRLISRQFGNLFNSYSQSINKATGRTGGLLEEPFRRVPLKDEGHAKYLIYYIHTNAQKHGFVKDFRMYPQSSFPAYLSDSPTKLKKEEVISWFGNVETFVRFHFDGIGSTTDEMKYLEIES